VKNLNLEIFIYFPNILVTVELYGLQVSITIKEHEKDRRASAPPVFSLKLHPCPFGWRPWARALRVHRVKTELVL
jgi:hypothetical protein